MSYHNQNNPFISEADVTRNNQEITIDCENYSNNGTIHVNNGSSNLNSSHRRNQSGTSGLANSSSAPTLFESTADNSSFRVVRSYREYAAQFFNSDDSLDSNSDITGAAAAYTNDGISIDDKNTYDAYESKSNIDYEIKKSKTVKSTSTSSSKTAYKNPTLSSVVNQTLVNSSFDKNYYDQYDDIKKIKEENHKKADPQLKLQKMILNVPESYDIPTRNKKIISQRILNVTLVLMTIIATTLLALYIYLKLNHGYSYPHIKDISDYNRTKLIFIALFMYLAIILGSVGSALNWKSILVTYCVFCTLNALALGYLVFGIYDDAYNYTHLPSVWWDTYSASTRRSIQDRFSCCGFKEPLDGGEISNVCPKEAVVWNIPYELIYDNFMLLKKDAVAREMNATVVDTKNKVVLPTPVIEQAPTPTPSAADNIETNPVQVDTSNNNEAISTTTTTTENEAPEGASNNLKRSFEINDEALEILNSPTLAKNIYNILAANEIEEENDGRDDKDIARIRVLNKRTFIAENDDQYQARTNSTNPDIDYDKVRNSNYTYMNPDESRAFAKSKNLEGCEAKITPYIHKNLVPIFYVLLVFFCLYIITIPTALVFLFKLRTIPSINEFE